MWMWCIRQDMTDLGSNTRWKSESAECKSWSPPASRRQNKETGSKGRSSQWHQLFVILQIPFVLLVCLVPEIQLVTCAYHPSTWATELNPWLQMLSYFGRKQGGNRKKKSIIKCIHLYFYGLCRFYLQIVLVKYILSIKLWGCKCSYLKFWSHTFIYWHNIKIDC